MGQFHTTTKNLNAVTTATNGTAVTSHLYDTITMIASCTVNTGAVTISLQGSPDNSTWATLTDNAGNAISTLFDGATGTSSKTFIGHVPYVRLVTASQTNATITGWISAGSL